MGKGIDMARDACESSGEPTIHHDILDDLKDQLLIVLLKRLQNKYKDSLSFTVKEVDDTGGDLLSFNVVDNTFNFVLSKKQ